MKFRDMLPFRRSLYLGIAVWSLTATAQDALFQTYCSTQNTGSDYAVVNNLWQSNGACHDQCIQNGNYAFAIVQWQNCWCSNYVPADQASVDQDCSATCPGFPDEKCGNQDTGYYGYIALNAQPSGTAGAAGASSPESSSVIPSSTVPSSSEEPETSYTADTSTSTTSTTPTTRGSTSTPPSTIEPVIPVTSTIVQTISGNVVTQTVTSTPVIAPNSHPDNIEFERQSGLSAGTVAGIVIGVVGGLIILALAAFLLWRRRRTSTSENRDGGANGSNKSMTRNVSVLSKAGLLSRGHRPSMSERDHDDQYYIPPPTGSNSVRHSMMFGGGDGVDPISPLDGSHSSGSRRPSQPMVYDQRLNPSALFANQEANGSRISMQDQEDYSRPLGIMNPDPRPSFESRLSHA